MSEAALQGTKEDHARDRYTEGVSDLLLVGAVTRPETHPAKAAREMAEGILDATPTDAALAAGAA